MMCKINVEMIQHIRDSTSSGVVVGMGKGGRGAVQSKWSEWGGGVHSYGKRTVKIRRLKSSTKNRL